ncbi:ATP-binding protein [Paenibacillus xylanexedens]|uniref:ATP-binding protein n=1 Tax=Paenibacillus xylanexedens TaxID=528191 RepID=UPI0011A53961|nr:ATP-binding protein [Paenibacillus xylanexedens]
MNNTSTNAGALPSNAGDDFHLLWAAQKLLKMLNHNSDLSSVTVEGPAWQDSIINDLDESKLYSIDLAEYYGGETVHSATRIIFSQLKYSTYMGKTAWTTSNLCHSDNKKRDNSVIRRLADTYEEYTKKYTHLKDKITLKLVSNRPISAGLEKAIKEAKELLLSKEINNSHNLIGGLSDESKLEIKKIYEESKLKSLVFLGFIKAIDFEDCGAETRSIQKAKIIQQLGVWGIDSIQNKYNELVMTIRDRMMPERNTRVPMTKDFVCSLFGGNYARFFPAPTNIPEKKYIERTCTHELIKTILKQDNKSIFVHATAGIGKTTLVNNLQNHLPSGSAVVFYDCYGGGTYLQPSDSRYEYDTAILQICNTLAIECKTDFLLERRLKESEFWYELSIRMKQASKYVKSYAEDAIVLLIIDAADNSVFAAEKNNKVSFVHNLLQQPLPEGIKVLLTYRTEHAHYFKLPHNSTFFEVPSFNLQESVEHVKSYSLELAEETLSEFHHLSKGIPRVQSYVLAAKQSTPHQLVNMLLPNGKTTDDLLRDILEELRLRYGEGNDKTSFIFGVLINLPRPIPITVATRILNCSQDVLQSLSVDCSFGLYIEHDFIFFRDEDFETFLRERYCDNSIAINIIADYMYQNRYHDAYSAKHVHTFLGLLNDTSKLLNITLNESIDESIIDVTEASKIMLSRIKSTLSLPLLKSKQYRMETFQLIYRSIDFSKNDEAITRLIKKYPEQASLYCDNNTLLQVFTTERNNFEELGKAVFVFSMDTNTKSKALSYLDSYRGSLNYYYSKQGDNRGILEGPRQDDILNIVDSVVRLKNATDIKRWITASRNKKFQADIIFGVLVRLINRNELEAVTNILKINWPSHCKLSIVAAYLKCRQTPPIDLIEYLNHLFNRLQIIDSKQFDQTHSIFFLEYLLNLGNHKLLNTIISKYHINFTLSYLSYIHGEDEHQMDINIRLYVLIKTVKEEPINSDDFIDYEGLNKSFKKGDISERINDIKKVYDFLLPAYKYRIAAIKGDNCEESTSLYNDCLVRLDRLYWWSDRDINKAACIRLCILALADGILNTPNLNHQDIYNHLSGISTATKIYRDTKLALSDLCASDRRSQQFTLETLESLSSELTQHPTSASEATEVYIRCAQIGQKIQKDIGRGYFEKALRAAKGQDYESYKKLELLNILSDNSTNKGYLHDTELSHEFIRLAEDFYRKLWDSKNYPYKEVFTTATKLNPMNIFSAICRLDDRDDCDHFSLPESSFHVLKELLRLGVYQPDIIASLSTILLPEHPLEYNELAKMILFLLSEAPGTTQQNAVEILIHDTLYNVPLTYKETLAKEIITYIGKYNFSTINNSSKLVSLHEFLVSTLDHDSKEPWKMINENKTPYSDKHLTDTIVISDVQHLTEYLKKLDRNNQLNFIDTWLAGSLSEAYVLNANLLLELSFESSYLIYGLEIQQVFIKYLNKWSLWPDVKSWRDDAHLQKKIFVNNMYKILHYPGYYDNLMQIFTLSSENILSFFVEYLVNENDVSSESILEILKKISILLPSDMAVDTLRWCIFTEVPDIHPKSGDQPYEVLSHIDDALLQVSKLLWRMLGHPDKKLRFKATHIIQNIHSCGRSDIINNLINLYELPFDQKYTDRKNFFFYDSAKLFFLLVCHRIFLEEPQMGKYYYNFFKDIACSNQIIHALQRHLAKQISLKIAEELFPEDIPELLACDEMKCGTTKKKARYARANLSSKQQFRFHFDYMDTLPYWYNDLAKIFILTQEEVAKDCDNYIDLFNINNNSAQKWRNDFIQYNRYRSRNTHNSHGSLPEIETLEKYAEWHAMFYVADQYRCTLPYSEESHHDYHEWLDSYLPGYQGNWTTEYRDLIPFIPFLWEFKKYKNSDNEQEYMIPKNLIHSILFNEDYVCTYLNYHSSFDHSYQSISIKSALIDEKSIDELITELKKPYVFFEDFYEANPEDYMFREKTNITIKPMIVDVHSFKSNRLDQHDPFAKDLNSSILTFVDEIRDFTGQNNLNLNYFSLPLKNFNLPIRIKNWSEPGEEEGYSKQGTYGSIAEINFELCTGFLKEINKALVFEYHVTFEDQTYQFSGVPSKTAKEKGVLILRSNGKIESHIKDLTQEDLID